MMPYMRLLGLSAMLLAGVAFAQETVSVARISVMGRGEVTALPDSAQLSFAAVARHQNAAEAQAQVNRVMTKATDAVRALGVDAERLSTSGVSLMPVYEEASRPEGGRREGRIIAYHASNRLDVRLEGTALLGKVIDAAVGAGANSIEGAALTLVNDADEREEALRRAVIDARSKADAIAAALGVRVVSVEQVMEQGVGVFAPSMLQARGDMGGFAAEAAPTPIAAGQVRVEANVQVIYRIAQGL